MHLSFLPVCGCSSFLQLFGTGPPNYSYPGTVTRILRKKKDSGLLPYKNGIKHYVQMLSVNPAAPEMVITMRVSVELHQT